VIFREGLAPWEASHGIAGRPAARTQRL